MLQGNERIKLAKVYAAKNVAKNALLDTFLGIEPGLELMMTKGGSISRAMGWKTFDNYV